VGHSSGTERLPGGCDAIAPDGSCVRVLLRLAGGSMAHFEPGADRVSRPVAHHCVDEIWYILHGRGEMWRRQGDRQETVPLAAGTCLTIPAGTHFPVPLIPGWSPDGRSRDDAAVAWPWRGLPGQREVGDRSAVSRQRWDNPVQLPGLAARMPPQPGVFAVRPSPTTADAAVGPSPSRSASCRPVGGMCERCIAEAGSAFSGAWRQLRLSSAGLSVM
jgi:hypothetical protein